MLLMAQMSPIQGDVDANFEIARRAVQETRQREANLIVFPELSLTGYQLDQKREEISR
jgi:predicted amidohydrolase